MTKDTVNALAADQPQRAVGRLPALVWATGWVSFFADMSTELIYGVLPAFYAATLNLSVAWMGLIEGVAETVVSLTKLLSGHWSDRTGGRKWWMVAGYSLSTICKPLLAVASSGAAVLALRSGDRLGKGIRGAPRDALIANVIHPDQRGRAFGVQRALDHAGALAGGLCAAGLLYMQWATVNQLFWWSVVPGAVAVAIIFIFVRESRPSHGAAGDHKPSPPVPLRLAEGWRRQQRAMKRYLFVLFIFSLGNSTDMLLLMLARDRLLAAQWPEHAANAALPLLWALLHVVKAMTTPWGGRFSDRVGRRAALHAGWLLYALVYAGFALGSGVTVTWVLFGVYGLHFGLVEGPERALIADLADDPDRRGMAFGLFHFATGMAALPASLLCGGLWYLFGPMAAFLTGAALAIIATIMLAWALRDVSHQSTAGGQHR